jgi:Fibronectin type III domain
MSDHPVASLRGLRAFFIHAAAPLVLETSMRRGFCSPNEPDHDMNVTGTAGNGQVTVSWTAPASNGGSAITGYQVQLATSGGTYLNAAGCPTTSTTTSCTATGLINGTKYFFRVAAINGVGPGPYSAPSSGVTPTAKRRR